MKDFQDEISGYCNNKLIVDSLNDLDLKDSVENISTIMTLLYNALIEIGLVGEKEIVLINSWLQDINSSILN